MGRKNEFIYILSVQLFYYLDFLTELWTNRL